MVPRPVFVTEGCGCTSCVSLQPAWSPNRTTCVAVQVCQAGAWLACMQSVSVCQGTCCAVWHQARGDACEQGGAAAQVVKVAGVSLWALFREKKEKPRN